MKIGRKPKGVHLSSAKSQDDNDVAQSYLRATQSDEFRKWEQTLKTRALPTSKANDVRKQFQQHISRPADVQAMLDEIAQKLAQ